MDQTKLCIPADNAAVAAAVAAARHFALAANLPPEHAARLAIVTEELVCNLVDHAALPAGAAIELTIALANGRICLALLDPAEPFDPRIVGPAAIPARGGGAGLALVRAFARIDDYARVGNRNRLLLSLPASS